MGLFTSNPESFLSVGYSTALQIKEKIRYQDCLSSNTVTSRAMIGVTVLVSAPKKLIS